MDTNIVIEGRLTRNAEMKSAGTSTVTTFAIANNQAYKKDGNWIDNPYFFDCEIWGTFGETMRQYLTKGQKVTITGQLVQNRWTDADGKTHSSIKLRVKDLSIQFEKKTAATSAAPAAPAEANAPDTSFNPQELETNPYGDQQEIAF